MSDEHIEGSCHCGGLKWRFQGRPDSATMCNCTICRRYGALWIYDFEGERIEVEGRNLVYIHGAETIGFHFCPDCACIAYWRGLMPDQDGRRRIAVNLRMADPSSAAAIPVQLFDGLTSFSDLEPDGRCIRDVWF